MTKKEICLVNDDGIYSTGILAAARTLSKYANVTIIAPKEQKSGVGRSISLRKPLNVEKIKLDDFKAYSVDGTPVDSVIVGLYAILDNEPDLVVSGINLGENMSSEITTSGTVCAAIEAANHDIPSIAISLHLEEKHKFGRGSKVDFTLAQKALEHITKELLEKGLPQGVDLLNINVPDSNVPDAPYKTTRLAHRMYRAKVRRMDNPHGGSAYLIDGDAIFDAKPDTDVYTVRIEKAISITPLQLDFTVHNNLSSLKF